MVAIKQKLQEFCQYLGNADFTNRSRPLRFLLAMLRILVFAAKKFRHDLCFERAAALSFIAILSAIPVGFLFLYFMRAFDLFDYWNQLKTMILENFTEGSRDRVKEWFGIFEGETLGAFAENAPYYVMVISGLVFSALWLFEASEKALNRIWGAARSRSYVQRFTVFWLIVTASPFLLAASSVLTRDLEQNTHVDALVKQMPVFEAIYGFIVPAAIATLAFFFVYLLLPSCRVRFVPAVAGAIFAGVCWELAKDILSKVVANAVTFSVYGSLGAVAAIFFWFYFSWAVLLFGAQISFVTQHAKETVAQLAWRGDPPQLPPGLLAVAAAVEIAKTAASGTRPPTLQELAQRWSLTEEAMRRELKDFTPHVFHRTSGEEDTYYLSRDTDSILIRELLASRRLPAQPALARDEIGELLSLLRVGQEKALADLTIRDVLNRNLSLRSNSAL